MADKVLFTGCIDEFYDYRFGRLEYRSLCFEHERLEIDNYQGNAVVNYCEREIPYTRIIEHKHFEFGTQPCTVITREYPAAFTAENEPYYPVNDDTNMMLLKKYKIWRILRRMFCLVGVWPNMLILIWMIRWRLH